VIRESVALKKLKKADFVFSWYLFSRVLRGKMSVAEEDGKRAKRSTRFR
jgi:hypothetical protein